MDICRMITSVWTITVNEEEVFNRFIDESLQQSQRMAVNNMQALPASDNDKAVFHRYYCGSLAELSAVLARRTKRVGGDISNTVDETTGFITTVYSLAMTDNHESELLQSLAAHCLNFLVLRTLERWYGHGSDFGAALEKDNVRHVLHYRRIPIERPLSVL